MTPGMGHPVRPDNCAACGAPTKSHGIVARAAEAPWAGDEPASVAGVVCHKCWMELGIGRAVNAGDAGALFDALEDAGARHMIESSARVPGDGAVVEVET